MIVPGKTIGILGGGALARETALAAAHLGYRVHVYSPVSDSLAGEVSAREVTSPYADEEALREFVRKCDVVTCETEEVPVESLWKIEKDVLVRPHWSLLEIAQNRVREKNWLRKNGFPHVPFAELEAGDDLNAAVRKVGLPSFVKRAESAGGGAELLKIPDEAAIAPAANAFARTRAVVERMVDFRCELSVTVARTRSEVSTFPITENLYSRYTLDLSVTPARVSEVVASEAEQLARAIAEKLDLVGLITVELFVTDRGEILVNRLHPRPHVCGHAAGAACPTSQAEQLVRAICELPLGSTKVGMPTACVNLPPEVWARARVPNDAPVAWPLILADPAAKLFLSTSRLPAGARPTGYFAITSDSASEALERARSLKERVLRESGPR